ncbi:hypothetical protein GCM10011519_19200 [Marmoricola endophyticus]|uniref:Uncharacterized protein n=1 Tax=Marmoricola endophyticus TaxID=2040280 RepID=A0A917BHE9_9ACTN|nr:hypothetical protein [Marmoricola endophyticus]GGF45458.1 hypothetical protein GCM10011519_19200 [Marmoricola endophyticus]
MTGLAGVLLILVGALALARATWVVRGRRSPTPRPHAPVRPHRVDLLGRALASLAPAAAYAVRLADREVRVLVAGDLPAPWVRRSDGWWSVAGDDLPVASRPGSYAAVVRLAVEDGSDVLVDLGRAPGLVSLGGDPALARRTALQAVRDLLVRTTVAELEVSTPTDPDTAPELLGGVDEPVPDDVLVGRVAPVRDRRLRVLVLQSPPSPAVARRLTALVESREASVAVLVVGDSPEARWRLAVDRTGALDLGELALAQGSA